MRRAQREEDKHAENWPFDGSDAPDDDDENHIGCPVSEGAKAASGEMRAVCRKIKGAGQARHGRGDQEDRPFDPRGVNAYRLCGVDVVAHRGSARPKRLRSNQQMPPVAATTSASASQ